MADKVEKQKKKLVSEKVLRRRQDRLMKQMETEIASLKERLQKYEVLEPKEIEDGKDKKKGVALFKNAAKKISNIASLGINMKQ